MSSPRPLRVRTHSCLKFPSQYQIVLEIFIRHCFENNNKSPGLRLHCVEYHRLRSNNIIPVSWELLWHLIKLLSQMPLFIYAFLLSLNAVKLCRGRTFYLRDVKLYDHSMYQNRISLPIWISLNQCNDCHLKFLIFTYSQNQIKLYVILSSRQWQ